MPTDLTTIADPRFVLLAWASGLAIVAAYVSWVRVVGAGFSWLTGGTAVLVGIAGALAEGALWARVGLVLVVSASVLARRKAIAAVLFLAGGLALLVEAGLLGGLVPGATASLALGAVTGEMLLGHWYLVDPRLPRWALRWLALAAIAGLAIDGAVLTSVGTFPEGGGALVFWLLLATSALLMVAVIAALRYPAYSGVMAATGLSYLAVLTSLGTVFMGRALIAGLGPFT